jgi:hypothetical protein
MALQLLEGATMRFAVYVPPAKRTIRGRRRARGRSKALGYRSIDLLPFVDEASPYPDPLPLPSLVPLYASFVGDLSMRVGRASGLKRKVLVGSTPNLNRGLMERVLGAPEPYQDVLVAELSDPDVIEVRGSDGSWMREPTPTRYRGKRR